MNNELIGMYIMVGITIFTFGFIWFAFRSCIKDGYAESKMRWVFLLGRKKD